MKFVLSLALLLGATGTALAQGDPRSFPDLLTGQSLPADLASEAATSPLLGQYAGFQPDGLARSSQLTQTDLTNAFVPDAS
jgi:hypothetical protein